MTTKDCYSDRFDRALVKAAAGFRGVRRKGSGIPYIAHLLQVCTTVTEHGGDEDQMIAALLHDYLEDVDGSTPEELEAEFGERVAAMVRALSDTIVRPKPAWGPRKTEYLQHLRYAPADVKLVSAADKLHNASTIVRDLRDPDVGQRIFERFSASRERTLWYYRGVVRALGHGWSGRLLDRLDETVDEMHRLAQAPRPPKDGEDPLPPA